MYQVWSKSIEGCKKRCVIQQQLFRVISVLKIKGQLIIYLLLVSISLVFQKDVSPLYYPLANEVAKGYQ
jgi:hypothetical protein